MEPTAPQGLSDEQFTMLSRRVREAAGSYGSDIAVHGSRAAGAATAGSDIDIAIRVTPGEFDRILNARFGTPVPGSAKERTKQGAQERGMIQRGELGLSGLGKSLQRELGIDVDISVIRIGGPMDRGPYIPLN